MHGRTTGLDCLDQNRLLVFDVLASLVQHLVHTLGSFVGQLMGMRFGSLRMPSQLPATDDQAAVPATTPLQLPATLRSLTPVLHRPRP